MKNKSIQSCILLRSKETGEWHYSSRTTSAEETKKELKEVPLNFGEKYSFHGVYESWLSAVTVARELHEKELEQKVGSKLHSLNKVIYD
jgi:hypothetical protein